MRNYIIPVGTLKFRIWNFEQSRDKFGIKIVLRNFFNSEASNQRKEAELFSSEASNQREFVGTINYKA